jgi:tetratricopeptide (TPR) repeat protein
VKTPAKSYYETLEIDKTADKQQIKRAYFTLVRRYQPDRFPEEFKELRAAYETLFDEKKRAEYDEIGALPKLVAPLFHYAQQAYRLGRYDKSSELYRKILQTHPKLLKIRSEYALSLLAEDKPGKAMEQWEILCKEDPSNPSYARELAQSYENRGWHRKAITEYLRGIELDRGCAQFWTGLIHCHEDANDMGEVKRICLEAFEIFKENDMGTVSLYTVIFMSCGMDDRVVGKCCLQNVVRLIRQGRIDTPRSFAEYALSGIILMVTKAEALEFFPLVLEIAELTPQLDDRIKEILAETKLQLEIRGLASEGFSDIFHDIFAIQVNEENSKEARLVMAALEWTILTEKAILNPQLVRLKSKFPDLYELHETFFDEALSTTNREKLIQQRLKLLEKHHRVPCGFNEAEAPPPPKIETVRRSEPKIGRNDPCPCGSGKKYKKCCGR